MTKPTCHFDTWTPHGKVLRYLTTRNATLLETRWGFHFWEDPIHGDMAPVLATETTAHGESPIWNTQDFDLPTEDPRKPW